MDLAQCISNKLDSLWIQSANTEVALEVQTSPENYVYGTSTTPPPTPLFQQSKPYLSSQISSSSCVSGAVGPCCRGSPCPQPWLDVMPCTPCATPSPPPPKQQQGIPKRRVMPVLPLPSPWNPGVHWCIVQWTKMSEGSSPPLLPEAHVTINPLSHRRGKEGQFS